MNADEDEEMEDGPMAAYLAGVGPTAQFEQIQERGLPPEDPEQPSHLDHIEDRQDRELGHSLDWLEAKVEDGQELTPTEVEELRWLKTYFDEIKPVATGS